MLGSAVDGNKMWEMDSIYGKLGLVSWLLVTYEEVLSDECYNCFGFN